MARSSPRRWFLGLALIGLAERLALRLVYSPASFGDTPSYMRLAEALQRSGLGSYDGTRAPGYPAFLALLGRDPGTVWLAQMALGWGASMLLFSLGWKTTGSLRLGAAAAMLYNLTAGLILFEANLLSETLTAFLVLLSLALLMALNRRAARAGEVDRAGRYGEWGLAAGLGITAALAGLTRPLFYVLPPVLAPFVWLAGGLLRRAGRPVEVRAEAGRRIARLAAFALPAALLLGGWILWVYRTYEMLSPTTMGGYHLVQHTGEYFEYLPDEQATLRDTYLKYRDAQIAARGTQANAIWDAIPELSEVSGLSFFGLSAELQRLSLQLIRQHPLLYLENVVEGWIDFWKAPVYWDSAGLRFAWLRPLFSGWTLFGRGLSLAANAAFLLASAGAVVSRSLRARLGLDWFGLGLGGTVWTASVVQTLADHGDNPRFLVPLQAVVMLAVLRAIWSWRQGPSGDSVA